MKTLITRALIATALVASAGGASADPVTAEYLVQRKPLVVAMNGTDTMDFKFYSDPNCQNLTHQVAITADSPAIHFERVRSQRIGRTRSADLIRITAIVEDAPASAPFLRVDGPGVTPAMTTCQPQGGGSGLRFIDTSITDTILRAAGVESVDEARIALEKGQLPPNVVCELLTEILSQGGAEIPVGICATEGDESQPVDLLGGLLGMN
jgi:hypothetical protein